MVGKSEGSRHDQNRDCEYITASWQLSMISFRSSIDTERQSGKDRVVGPTTKSGGKLDRRLSVPKYLEKDEILDRSADRAVEPLFYRR